MKRSKPQAIENIPTLKRKEQSIYKPTDLWTQEDDLLFLKYCPSKRDRTGSYRYAEVLLNGKTGSRPIPLITSIPYLKDWLVSHPQTANPNAFLIPSLSDRNFGRKISSSGIHMNYRRYKLGYFTQSDSKFCAKCRMILTYDAYNETIIV
jgi:integrase/recombinase XerD